MSNATEIKFGDPAQRVAQTGCWTVLLRPRQPTLGSLVLVCREPVRSFADVSPQGFAEMRQVIGLIEATLREVATFERINYLMLMMVDPDVHMHVIPRYQATRSFAGVEFADAGWPGPPMLDAAVLLDGATSAALLARLRDVWAGCAAEDRAP